MRCSIPLSIALLAGVVLADSTLIPSDVSSSCQNFLKSLDTHNDLATCTNAIITTTKAFTPGGSKPSSSDLANALQGLCHSNNTCPDGMFRGLLMNFNSECRDELVQSGHNDVKNIYDGCYVLSPFRSAICSTDPSTNQYCVNRIKSSLTNSTGPLSSNTTSNFVTQPVINPLSIFFEKYLSVSLGSDSPLNRRSNSGLTPNVTTWQTIKLAMMFMDDNGPASQLCTPCTKSILQSYTGFESLIPYAPGLVNSPLIGSQVPIWNAVASKCGNQFMNAILTKTPAGALAMRGGTVSVKAGMTGLSVMGTLALGLFLAS